MSRGRSVVPRIWRRCCGVAGQTCIANVPVFVAIAAAADDDDDDAA